MPNLHIDTGSKTVDLWQAEQDRDERKGIVDVSPRPSFDSEDAFQSGMTEDHTGTVRGTATGNRLSDQPGYSNDPVTALAEWVQETMALVDGTQGTGYTLTHDVRGYSKNIVIESFGWTRDAGAKLEASWDMTFRIGEGAMVGGSTPPNTASPSSSWSLGGTDLQRMAQIRESKSQIVKGEPMVLADSAEENIIITQSGARRDVTIVGRHTGTRAEQQSFDSTMRGFMGQNQIVTYSSPFPGHTIDVMVDGYTSTLESGYTDHTDYELVLIEGVNQ